MKPPLWVQVTLAATAATFWTLTLLCAYIAPGLITLLALWLWGPAAGIFGTMAVRQVVSIRQSRTSIGCRMVIPPGMPVPDGWILVETTATGAYLAEYLGKP